MTPSPSEPTAGSSSPAQGAANPRRRSWKAAAVLLLLVAVAAIGFRPWAAWVVRNNAQSCLQEGRLTAATWWLDWGRRWASPDGRRWVLRARIARELGQSQQWKDAIQAARLHQAPPDWIESEELLARVAAGDVPSPQQAQSLFESDVIEPRVASGAMVHGYLKTRQLQFAHQMLDMWATDFPDDPQAYYLRGEAWEQVGNLDEADKSYRRALELSPKHEAAGLARARLLVRRGRLPEALEIFAGMLRWNDQDRVRAGAARCLQLLGRPQAARRLLDSAGDSYPVLVQRGLLALDAGQYDDAAQLLRDAGARSLEQQQALATALSLAGHKAEARRLLAEVSNLRSSALQLREQQTRQMVLDY